MSFERAEDFVGLLPDCGLRPARHHEQDGGQRGQFGEQGVFEQEILHK